MRVPLPGISREQSVTLIIGPPQNRFFLLLKHPK